MGDLPMKTTLRNLTAVLAAALVSGAAATAFAQSAPADRVVIPKVTRIDISDGNVLLGEVQRPGAGLTVVRPASSFLPVVQVRGSYRFELASSAEQL